jgi:hypothetical protein
MNGNLFCAGMQELHAASIFAGMLVFMFLFYDFGILVVGITGCAREGWGRKDWLN